MSLWLACNGNTMKALAALAALNSISLSLSLSLPLWMLLVVVVVVVVLSPSLGFGSIKHIDEHQSTSILYTINNATATTTTIETSSGRGGKIIITDSLADCLAGWLAGLQKRDGLRTVANYSHYCCAASLKRSPTFHSGWVKSPCCALALASALSLAFPFVFVLVFPLHSCAAKLHWR